MSTRVAINGFGRIGRAVLRSAIERDAELEIVAVHDVAPADMLAQLLQRDSVYGRFAHPVRAEDGALVVADRRIQVIDDDGRARCRRGASSASTSSSRPPAGFARAQTPPATSRPAHAR